MKSSLCARISSKLWQVAGVLEEGFAEGQGLLELVRLAECVGLAKFLGFAFGLEAEEVVELAFEGEFIFAALLLGGVQKTGGLGLLGVHEQGGDARCGGGLGVLLPCLLDGRFEEGRFQMIHASDPP